MSRSARSRGPLRSQRTSLVAVYAVLIAGVGLAGCGSSGSSSSSTAVHATAVNAAASDGSSAVSVAGVSVAKVSSLASTVPAATRSQGLNTIFYNYYPPDEFVKSGQLEGSQVDLARAVAAVLGLQFKMTASAAFDTFIPSIQSGRYNASFVSLQVTPARTKVVDIVSTESTGTGFASKAGGGTPTLSTPLDLCGHKFAGIVASAYVASVQAVGAKCQSAGKPALTIATYPTDAAAELAVQSGRQQYYVSGANEIAWRFGDAGGILTAQPLDFSPVATGAAVSKASGLAGPISAAINHLIDTGAYKAIMAKWHEGNFAVHKSALFSG